jgi:hypothetical protein
MPEIAMIAAHPLEWRARKRAGHLSEITERMQSSQRRHKFPSAWNRVLGSTPDSCQRLDQKKTTKSDWPRATFEPRSARLSRAIESELAGGLAYCG